MKVKELRAELALISEDCEVLVAATTDDGGRLIVPTKGVRVGVFHSGGLAGSPWVQISGTDVWGQYRPTDGAKMVAHLSHVIPAGPDQPKPTPDEPEPVGPPVVPLQPADQPFYYTVELKKGKRDEYGPVFCAKGHKAIFARLGDNSRKAMGITSPTLLWGAEQLAESDEEFRLGLLALADRLRREEAR